MQTLEDVLIGFGMNINGVIPADGIMHRFRVDGSKDTPGWVVKFLDGAGFYGDWRKRGDGHYWHPSGKGFADMSDAERAEIDRRRGELIIAKEKMREQVAGECLNRWMELSDSGDSQYLADKGVGVYGVRFDGNGCIVIPAKDINGKLWSLQTISGDGTKRWASGGKVSGNMHIIDGEDKTVLCEGYATGASIHEATGFEVVVCFDAGNMVKVAEKYKGKSNVLVAADFDAKSGKGKLVAEEIKAKFGIDYVIPDAPGDFNDAAQAGDDVSGYFFETLDAYTFDDYLNDSSPIPDDLIEPRIMIQGGMVVIAGEPKVGKSEFIMLWLAHMAAGLPFMGMRPSRPLKIFYLQTEITYHMMRERIQYLNMPDDHKRMIKGNMVTTPRVNMLLNEGGVQRVGNTMRKHGGDFDIIAVDPISNVFDGESENHNSEMLAFLQNRVEALRHYSTMKGDMGIVLVHHTKKANLEELITAPFQCFRGASSLRGYYNTGMIMYKEGEGEQHKKRIIAIERRDAKPNDTYMPNLCMEKIDGRWFKIDNHEPLVPAKKADNRLADRERQRKLIYDFVAKSDYTYSRKRIAEENMGKNGFGSKTSINDMILNMLEEGVLSEVPLTIVSARREIKSIQIA